MTDEMKPVRCGCGGEAKVIMIIPEVYAVECSKCWIRTGSPAKTEADAVIAWNRAMGGNVQECAENARCNERIAKVTTVEKPIEGSIRTISVMACENCENVVSIFDNYCAGCGCRLEWE